MLLGVSVAEPLSRRRRNGVVSDPEPLEYAAECQRAMHEAIGERSRAFLAAADAGHTIDSLAQRTGMSRAMVWKIIKREEELREAGYITPPPRKRIGRLPGG